MQYVCTHIHNPIHTYIHEHKQQLADTKSNATQMESHLEASHADNKALSRQVSSLTDHLRVLERELSVLRRWQTSWDKAVLLSDILQLRRVFHMYVRAVRVHKDKTLVKQVGIDAGNRLVQKNVLHRLAKASVMSKKLRKLRVRCEMTSFRTVMDSVGFMHYMCNTRTQNEDDDGYSVHRSDHDYYCDSEGMRDDVHMHSITHTNRSPHGQGLSMMQRHVNFFSGNNNVYLRTSATSSSRSSEAATAERSMGGHSGDNGAHVSCVVDTAAAAASVSHHVRAALRHANMVRAMRTHAACMMQTQTQTQTRRNSTGDGVVVARAFMALYNLVRYTIHARKIAENRAGMRAQAMVKHAYNAWREMRRLMARKEAAKRRYVHRSIVRAWALWAGLIHADSNVCRELVDPNSSRHNADDAAPDTYMCVRHMCTYAGRDMRMYMYATLRERIYKRRAITVAFVHGSALGCAHAKSEYVQRCVGADLNEFAHVISAQHDGLRRIRASYVAWRLYMCAGDIRAIMCRQQPDAERVEIAVVKAKIMCAWRDALRRERVELKSADGAKRIRARRLLVLARNVLVFWRGEAGFRAVRERRLLVRLCLFVCVRVFVCLCVCVCVYGCA
jgi:hypothetical protein